MKRIKTLYTYMAGQRLNLILSVISVAAATYFMIQIPFVIRFSIDSVIGIQNPDSSRSIVKLLLNLNELEYYKTNLWLLGILIISVTALRGFFLFTKGHYSATASEQIAKNLRERMYKHIQALPYEYHVKAETGDLIQRCTSDVDTIRRFIGSQFVEIGGVFFLIGMIIYSMLSMHVLMTLASIFILPFAGYFSIVFFKRINKIFTKVDEQEGKLSTMIQENLSGVRVVRAFGRQKHELERFNKENDDYSDKVYSLIKEFARFWSSQDLIVLTQTGIMIFVGTVLAVKGQITLGTFVAFATLAGYILWPVRTLGRILSEMSKSFVSVDRIEEVLNTATEYETVGEVLDLDGDIEFKDLSFHYESSDRDILTEINLKIKKGETLAILGPTGAGKSTLVHLLTRFYEPTKGSIQINGHDISGVDKHHLRHHVALILQEPFLFAKSLSENIKIAKLEASEHQIIEAAEVAQIHENIMEFDKGYETLVGEKGVSLSGGQKQRVAIARKLITDAPVLIFDDSLSAVDTETDAAIRARLNAHSSELTTIIISHRIATLSEADHIIVIEDGKITQEGNHESLLNQEGLYKTVWKIQDADALKKIS
ncbi:MULTISPECIES: ABC transporter ATP-binding protein [unclassified Fusibacter]|uniref:ABC transporter ATP-binding protein n=1 Tax=unclassified Fusibacter TaxID=2624464 RepID=UPI0010122E9A|nr:MULTISPECIES: ABC transporter ATP-binding protein [unclassified Fusibacter]MCK8061397.1 ABC transporter ATP-binding protein/permease [Fusibacter sp. A2]NPE23560.1 ABC transporter ATP-binding protein [Fusibacter sp. A1]RXV58970.1 ABC transporter ATP-binding protein [Fusibacter sp. A1]